MLLTRTKSKIWVHNPSSPNFSCPSFKDIQTLCSDDSISSNNSPTPTKKPNIFHRVRRVNAILRALSTRPVPELTPKETHKSEPLIQIPGAEKKIVIYFTSLRVIRSTFDDCKAVRTILRSFRVSIDERDVSMDAGFMEELRTILGVREKTKLPLPRVFIGGRYIGGADEIRELHEAGELKKYVEGLTPAAGFGACQVCDGHRFILCDECSGSHKCYSEKGGFRTCSACNENGLIRCPSCYYAPF
ncbi:uncharacterized protein At5g39865 [Nicotiana tabacum]|uniref:Uncharacterized protein At5g39865 n=2 Tax=Nicotiana TaxID=4085 RepID=A0A1S3ZF09_TOBAC|nr:PREDICTED: uncharacterized protein At5g39865 [Nicotiana sylvestris]XP_016463023.1 PREDICTED: uncharacterized protein At5g39865 [Nicotiana tabacum]